MSRGRKNISDPDRTRSGTRTGTVWRWTEGTVDEKMNAETCNTNGPTPPQIKTRMSRVPSPSLQLGNANVIEKYERQYSSPELIWTYSDSV